MHFLFMALGLGLVLFGLLAGHEAIAAPMKWSQALNVSYFAFVRPLYVLGIMLILFTFLTGGFSFGAVFLSRPFFLVTGKLCYITCLITPIMIELLFATMQRGLFIEFNRVLEFGMGNTFIIMGGAIIVYLFFEYPFRQLIQIYVYPSISADKDLYDKIIWNPTQTLKSSF
jgi:hypothetical protein